MISRRNILPLLAFLLLACFTGYSFKLERTHSDQNRAQAQQIVYTTLIAGCERNNELRKTLHDLVLGGIATTQKYVKEGTLTPIQGQRAIQGTKDAAKKLESVDCNGLYGKIRPPDSKIPVTHGVQTTPQKK